MRIVIDSDSYAAISGYRWDHKIGYVGGADSWSEAEIADASARGELLALVDVAGTEPRTASILAYNTATAANPARLHAWVGERNAFRGDATVLCDRGALTNLINALAGEQCYLWLDEPSAQAQPPGQPPVLGLPANLILLGVRYALEPDSSGPYNMSIFWDDSWHAAPGPRSAEAEVAAGTLEPRIDAHPADAGAEPLFPPPTGQRMMEPPGSVPQAGSEPSTGSSPAPARPVPAGALSTAPAAVPAPSSAVSPGSFQVPPGLLLTSPGLHPAAGPAAPVPIAQATSSSASTGPSAAPAMPSAAAEPAPASPAPATGSPASLPHGWIQTVIADMRKVAGQFRGAGASHAAQLIEQAAAAGAETGSLLMKAGL